MFLSDYGLHLYNLRFKLIERLLKEGYEVHISSPCSEQIDKLKELGGCYHKLSINRHEKNPVEEFRLLRTYKQLVIEVKPKIVIPYTVKPNVYGEMACVRSGVPCIANVTGGGFALANAGFIQKITLALYQERM